MKNSNLERTIHKKEVGISFSIFDRRPSREEDFAICHECGINKVQLVVIPGWLNPADERTIADVHHWAKEYGLTVGSVHNLSGTPVKPFWLADPNETTRISNVEGHKQVI
jgi:predicted xylose isomerase-like sugar epimerase